jgi:hypothetical protein
LQKSSDFIENQAQGVLISNSFQFVSLVKFEANIFAQSKLFEYFAFKKQAKHHAQKVRLSSQCISATAALKHCLKDLIPVLLPDYEKLNAFSDEELKSTIRKTIRRELDHLHLFHVPEKALILHIEHQSSITEKLKQRMLLYAALIYEKHPDKQLIQFVFYTGKMQSNLNTNVQLSHLKYHFPIIPLRNIPL